MAMLAEWNRKYAVVTIGGKVRILQESAQPGTMPPLFEIDAFRTLQANQKIAVANAEGGHSARASVQTLAGMAGAPHLSGRDRV